jgi:hypothetical protein
VLNLVRTLSRLISPLLNSVILQSKFLKTPDQCVEPDQFMTHVYNFSFIFITICLSTHRHIEHTTQTINYNSLEITTYRLQHIVLLHHIAPHAPHYAPKHSTVVINVEASFNAWWDRAGDAKPLALECTNPPRTSSSHRHTAAQIQTLMNRSPSGESGRGRREPDHRARSTPGRDEPHPRPPSST